MFGQMLLASPSTAGNFKVLSYTGTGSSQSITGAGFQPDLVTIFNKSNAPTYSWPSYDSVNGAAGNLNDLLDTNKYVADSLGVTAFNGSGFTIGAATSTNTNTQAYKAFCWKKASSFFDIQTYTGNATNRTVNHNLTVAPSMMIGYSNANGATVLYHSNMFLSPATVNINWTATGTITQSTDATMWNNTTPTSSVFSLGTNSKVNGTGQPATMYLWGAQAGFSSFGQYAGNGSVSGPSVATGFQPSLVMICQSSASGNNIYWIYGSSTEGKINQNTGEATTNFINITSTGFTVVTTNADFNTNLATYFYSAWK